MLTSSQSGSHEITTVESGQDIARDLNCTRDEDQIRLRLGQEGTASIWANFTRLINGQDAEVTLWMQVVERICHY